jgi:hypothetical protein
MFGKFAAVVALCLGPTLAQGAVQNPVRPLLIDACGQMRDNALRIWSDQRIVSIREDRSEKIVACYVGSVDRKTKSAFAVTLPAGDSREAARQVLLNACGQMREDPNEVFDGRRPFFREDPDIKVAYCLVAGPSNKVPESLLLRSRSYFVYASELLFMSYYGKPLEERT